MKIIHKLCNYSKPNNFLFASIANTLIKIEALRYAEEEKKKITNSFSYRSNQGDNLCKHLRIETHHLHISRFTSMKSDVEVQEQSVSIVAELEGLEEGRGWIRIIHKIK